MSDPRKEYFNNLARNWDAEADAASGSQERIRQILGDYISFIGSPLLDLGSGTGILVPALADLLPAGQKIVEFDMSLRMLSQTMVKNIDRVRILSVNGDAHYLPFGDRSMATVICFRSLPHFHDPHGALKEMHRILQSGGHLIVLHLMGHRQLNRYHSRSNGAIQRDYLPTLSELTGLVGQNKFQLVQALENEDLYLWAGRKK
jgi:ubiquinone/menaquinone biosynthesis C-methylase UbiE